MKNFITSSVVIAAIFMILPGPVEAQSDMSRLNRERTEVGRALLEMQSDNWASLLNCYTYDVEYHDPIVTIHGIDTMAQFLARLFGSSPNLVTTIEDEICAKGIYAASWTMDGFFNGVPYNAKGITIMKFRDRSTQVFYQRDYYTEGDIMINIPGLDEPIRAFRTYYRCAVDPTFDCPFEQGATELISPDRQTLPDHPGLARKTEPASVNSNLNVIRKKIGRALVEIEPSNWTTLLQFYANDIQYSDPIVSINGIATMIEFLARLFGSSPNLITTVEDELCIDGIYTATWTMDGFFNGVPYSAKGMSIVKFRPGEIQAYYSKDYYTEGDIMINIPGLDEPTEAFRTYYKCAVDPTFDCPFAPPFPDYSAVTNDLAGAEPLPTAFKLRQNIPNPFNPATTVFYDVPEGGGVVTLGVYDISGRLVRTLVNSYESTGTKIVTWDGNNEQGQPMASGMYFCRMTAPGFSEMKKMTLLR